MKKTTFVLDANVILNLYRYPSEASQELIQVLENLKNRIWIPFQVTLEYQRNRLKVIAEQKTRYHEVIKLLNNTKKNLADEFDQLQLKKRHPSIDPDDILPNINKVLDEHIDKINELEKKQLCITDEDDIRLKIDKILKDKIGKPFDQQSALDEIYNEGEKRFAVMTPPGYMDRKKGNDKEPEIYSYGGLSYNRKYGDLLVWKELLSYAKESNAEYIIFLTDDDKEDWWLYVNSLGNKRIGPRPELIQEIISFSNVKNFYMYNSEQFLKYAKDYLQASVSDESINQVKMFSISEDRLSNFSLYLKNQREAEQAVLRWLSTKYSKELIGYSGKSFPDYITTDDTGRKIGFEIKYFKRLRSISYKIKEFVYQGYYEINQGNLDELNFIVALEEKEDVSQYLRRSEDEQIIPEGVKITFGILIPFYNNENEKIFEPILYL